MLNIRIAMGIIVSAVISAASAQTISSTVVAVESTAPLTTLLTINPDKDAPRNSEGAIIRLSDSRLALVYSKFTGGDRDESSAFLAMRTSADEGKTWSEDTTLIPNEGGRNVMSVSLVPSADKGLLLFYLRKDSPHTSCTMYVRRSYDDLKTLSDPVVVTTLPGYHVVNNDRVLRLTTGRLLVPSALHTDFDTTITRFAGNAAMVCYYSDDDGRTWQKDNSDVPPLAMRKLCFQEPGVVELSDGSVMMYIRTAHGAQYSCISRNSGETWTEPKPTALKSPLSPATIERIPGSAVLVAVWNDHSGRWPYTKGNRTPLCIAVSHDNGKSWSPSELLEGDPAGWYCYTSMTFNGEKLLLSYCAGNGRENGLNRLKIAELPMEWVTALQK